MAKKRKASSRGKRKHPAKKARITEAIYQSEVNETKKVFLKFPKELGK